MAKQITLQPPPSPKSAPQFKGAINRAKSSAIRSIQLLTLAGNQVNYCLAYISSMIGNPLQIAADR